MNISLVKKDAKGLMSVADWILKKHHDKELASVEDFLNQTQVPKHIKGQATLSVMKNMNDSDWFSICNITELLKMTGKTLTKEQSGFMRSLHCVHWDKMTPDVKEYLNALILKIFEDEVLESDK